MSNEVNVQYTKFLSLGDEGQIISETYGYRIYDYYYHDYSNLFTCLKHLKEVLNSRMVLDFVRKNHPVFDVGDGVNLKRKKKAKI